jgi:hypothetical protein
MTDAVLTAMIGVAGSIVGSIATVAVARIQTAHKAARSDSPAERESLAVLGEAVDVHELRILRTLFGESKGRLLQAYKSGPYASALGAVLKKGWVRHIEGQYYLTEVGSRFCRRYLEELLPTWQPAQLLR